MFARTRSAAIAAFLFAAASSVFPQAQAPSPGKAVTESSSVTVIEIPVVVIGRDGNPVANLKPADFELFDEGKKQPISAVEVVDLRSMPPAATPPMARRHWLLVFDLTYTSPKGLDRAKEGAKSFVSHDIAASDLMGVATISVDSGWKLLVNFTSDRVSLGRAIDSVGTTAAALAGDPLAMSIEVPGAGLDLATGTEKNEKGGVEAREAQRMLERGNDARERGRIAQFVGTLSAVARTLDSVRGRKHVLFFSEGFESRLLTGSDRVRTASGLDQSSPDNQESANEQSLRGFTWNVDNDARFGSSGTRTRLGDALAAFRRSDTVLHCVDITGLGSSGIDASNSQKASGRDALYTMAAETDGELVKNFNELSGALQRVADRNSLVYILVYQPRQLQHPGAFHSFHVKVAASGARVSARAGFYEPRPFAALSEVEKRLATADLLTGGGSNPLSLSMIAAPFPAERGRALVPVILELPGPPLLAGPDVPQIPLQLFTYALDSTGAMRDYVTQDLTLDAGRIGPALRSGGIKYYATLSLEPGNFVIRAVARNLATGRTGNAAVSLTVPSTPGGSAFLSPPLFEAPPSAWVLVKRPPPAGQSQEYPFFVGGETFVPAAAPVLDPASEARFALVTYNFRGGSAPPPLDVRAEVADAAGKIFPAAVHSVGHSYGNDGARKLLVAFRPEGLPDGRYQMKVFVADRASTATAESSASFEVRRGSAGPAPADAGSAKN
jgi:VWFA-related protein